MDPREGALVGSVLDVPAAAFIASLAIVAAAVGELAIRRPGIIARRFMGLPDWDFGKSWASNVALFGALVTAALQALDRLKVDAGVTFFAMSLFFASLIVAAPLVYMIFRTGREKEGRWLMHGCVGAFLISSLVTSWGSLGQVGVLYFAIAELAPKSIPPGLADLLQGLFAITALLLAVYVNRSIYWTVATQAVKEDGLSGVALGESVHERQLPRWSVL